MITERDLRALTDLLNRVPKSTAEALWCQSLMQRLDQMRLEKEKCDEEKCDEETCEDCCSSAD